MGRIPRLVLVAALAVSGVLETPLGSLVLGFACAESCPDDIADGRCPPTCTSCACVPQGRTVALPSPTAVADTTSVTAVEPPPVDLPIDLLAVEILHVPRPSSA